MELLLLGVMGLLAADSAPSLDARVRALKNRGLSDFDAWEALALGGDGGCRGLARDGHPRCDGRTVYQAIEGARAQALGSAPFGRYVADWHKRAVPKTSPRACLKRGTQVCWRTKTDLLNVLRDANPKVFEHREVPGLNERDTSGTFDPVNHKYGLEGKRKVTTLAQALWAAAPARAPFCLDRIDLDVLNAIAPIRRAGGLELPEHVYDQAHDDEGAAAYYRGRREPDPEDTPF